MWSSAAVATAMDNLLLQATIGHSRKRCSDQLEPPSPPHFDPSYGWISSYPHQKHFSPLSLSETMSTTQTRIFLSKRRRRNAMSSSSSSPITIVFILMCGSTVVAFRPQTPSAPRPPERRLVCFHTSNQRAFINLREKFTHRWKETQSLMKTKEWKRDSRCERFRCFSLRPVSSHLLDFHILHVLEPVGMDTYYCSPRLVQYHDGILSLGSILLSQRTFSFIKVEVIPTANPGDRLIYR